MSLKKLSVVEMWSLYRLLWSKEYKAPTDFRQMALYISSHASPQAIKQAVNIMYEQNIIATNSIEYMNIFYTGLANSGFTDFMKFVRGLNG